MHLSRRTLLGSGAASAAAAALPATGFAATRDIFESPPSSARPWIRWWWPGGVVEAGELRREVHLLNDVGFGGAEIQAFNPAIPNLTADERKHLHDYANDAFFDHVNTAADEAAKKGLRIDYTLGSAWPSGGGFAITPELALLELTPAITSVEWPSAEPIKISIPKQTKKMGAMGPLDARNKDPRAAGWKERLEARQKLIAVVAIKAEAPTLKAAKKSFRDSDVVTPGRTDQVEGIVVTQFLKDDGVLEWTPPSAGTWQIIAFKQFTVDVGVLAGVGEGPQLILDHFNKAAFEAHARRVGAPLKSLAAKSAIRASFIDSLELMPDLHWSEDFLIEFKTRRGYDLTPYLPHLLQPGWEAPWNSRRTPPYFDAGEGGDRVREDYRQTVSELLIERFWQPFVTWNHQNGFTARLQAGGSPSDHLLTQGMADIPETEDLGTGGNTHHLRMARASANIYGRKLVSCESLCWIAKPYEKTTGDWVARANLLFASGVNQLIYHGFPYALHADAWPGWYPFAPSPFLSGFSSQINEANPVWAGISTLNTYVTRLQSLLQQGLNVVSVAVLHQDIGFGSNAGELETEHLLEQLLAHGFDYDRLNSDGLARSDVRDKRLVAPGGIAYQAVICPPMPSVRLETLQRLLEVAKAGVPIVFVDHEPTRAWGLGDATARDGAVQETVRQLKSAGTPTVGQSELPGALGKMGIHPNVEFVSGTALFLQKQLRDGALYFFHNPRTEAVTLTVKVRAKGHAQRLDPLTGKRTGIETKRSGDEATMTFRIEPESQATILFGKKALKPAPLLHDKASQQISGPWKLSAVGHTQGGVVINTTLDLPELTDLSTTEPLGRFSGESTYVTTFDLPSGWSVGARVFIDLGKVADMAIVELNDKPLGTLIASPFVVDAGPAVRAKGNTLKVRVFNNPNNAMINPKQAGLKDLKPVPTGLIGPVSLIQKQ